MKKIIKVTNDEENISVSNTGGDSYLLEVYNMKVLVTEDELRSIREMVQETIELANKRDY